MDWLETQHEIQRQKISLLKPRQGKFVQLNDWFGDVWSEVKNHYAPGKSMARYESVTIYESRRRGGTDLVYLNKIRTVRETLPIDVHILEIREGRFGGRDGKPFSELPKRIKEKFDNFDESAIISLRLGK